MSKLFSITIFLLLLPLVCWAGGNKEANATPTSQKQQQPNTSVPVSPIYWTGDGGKGKILSIRKLRPTGLAANESTIPTLVQVELHNNFSNYTAISTSTEESRNEQYAELLRSGHYDDNSKAGLDLGHLPDPDYIMEGTITKSSNGFALHINVTKTADKSTVGSFSEIVSDVELNDLRAVRRASLFLMQKMGVTPTELTKTELTRAALSNELAALNAVAKSDTATGFEKRLYTYQASQLDPTLAEAARRVAAYQTDIYQAPKINLAMPDIKIPEIKAPEFKAPEIKMAATGNIGTDARKRQEQYDAQKEASRLRQESGNRAVKDLQDAFLNQFKIQSEAVKKQQADLLKQRDTLLGQQKTLLARQRQMIAQLRETENSYDTFFTEHPPFEIIYDPVVKPFGNQDLVKGTIAMETAITTVGTQAMEVIPLMLADFEKGLETITRGLRDINAEFDKIQSLLEQAEANGRNALARLVNDYAAQMAKVEAAEKNYAAQLAKLDAELGTSGYAQLGWDYAVWTDARYAEGLARQYAVQTAGYKADKDKTLGDTWSLAKWNKDGSRTFVIETRLDNDKGKTIGTATVNLTNQILAMAYTRPLSASKSCVFFNVPVRDITDTLKVTIRRVNGRDVNIAANAGYIKISPLEADGYTKDGWNISGYDRNGYDKYGYTWDGYNKDGYKDGYDRNGYDRDGYNRNGYDRNGYNRDGYDRNGYDRKGRNLAGLTKMEIDRQVAMATAKQNFLDNAGLSISGWIGGGGGEDKIEDESEDKSIITKWGGDVELRLSRYLGLQTGFAYLSGGKIIPQFLQFPVLARLNLPAFEEIPAFGMPFFTLSIFSGIGINVYNPSDIINVQSTSPCSFIAGAEFNLTCWRFSFQYIRDFSDTKYNTGVKNSSYLGEQYIFSWGFRGFIPFH